MCFWDIRQNENDGRNQTGNAAHKGSDMEELAGQVLRKLDGMTDKEFLKISLEAAEEYSSKWVGSRLQWLATCFLFYNHKIDCEKSLGKL